MNEKYFAGVVPPQPPESATAGELGGLAVVKFVLVNAPSETLKLPADKFGASVVAVRLAAVVV